MVHMSPQHLLGQHLFSCGQSFLQLNQPAPSKQYIFFKLEVNVYLAHILEFQAVGQLVNKSIFLHLKPTEHYLFGKFLI